MADPSALSTSSSLPRSLASRRPLSSPLHGVRPRSSRLGSRLRARARKGGDPEDIYGPYPWEQPLDLTTGFDIEWVQEDKVTLFTADGLVQIGGSMVPRRVSASEVLPTMLLLSCWNYKAALSCSLSIKLNWIFISGSRCYTCRGHRCSVGTKKRQQKARGTHKPRRFQESSYMDPNQSLCLGALFNIAATNGLDMGRRLCIYGFCRSIEMLSDVVEDTVLEHGGEIVTAETASSDGGLQEKLTMSVAVPLLWGVPPASETLHVAVRSGGGIVDKIYWQWDLF